METLLVSIFIEIHLRPASLPEPKFGMVLKKTLKWSSQSLNVSLISDTHVFIVVVVFVFFLKVVPILLY